MMKKFLLLVLTLFIGNCVFASSINLKENNGIYHITLNGNSIKKRIQFVSVKNLDTNVNIGEIELDSVKFDNLDGEVNIGDFKIEDFKDFDDFNANLKADLGEIKIKETAMAKK